MSKIKFDRIHKRPFVVGVIVLLVFVLVGGFFVGYLGFFARGAELDRVRVGAEETGEPVMGFGLSLDHIPTANHVLNPSFENIQMDYMFTVQEGTENYAFLLMEQNQSVLFEEGAFEGGTIRVMSLNEEGRFIQKLQSVVVDFSINQLGLWREFDNVPDNLDTTFRFISASDTQIVAFGDDGYIVVGIGTADVSVLQMSVEGVCVASDYSDGRFSVLYSDGTILTSTDGRNFNAFHYAADAEGREVSYNTIASVNRVVVAAGDEGQINILFDGRMDEITPLSDANILTSAGDGDILLLLGEDGEMLATSNGSVFRSLSPDESPNFDKRFDWVSAAYSQGVFVLSGEHGQLARGRFDSESGRFFFEALIDTDELSETIRVRDIMIDMSGEIIMLDYSGLVYIYDQNIANWMPLSTDQSGDVVAIHSAPGRKIVFLTEDSVFTTSLVIRVQFEEHLTNVNLSAGDMCYLSLQIPAFESNQTASNGGHWDVFGDDTTAVSVLDAPTSGAHTSVRISGQTGDAQSAHYISQQLAEQNQILFSENIFYRVDLYLKQNGLESGEVMVWFSGDFESVGTTFSDVGTGWRRYSFRLVMPREACGVLSGDIRLNIGFYGDGEVYVDNIFLGRDIHSSEEIAQQFSDAIVEASPQYIRFPSLSIGKQGLSAEAFFSIPGNDRLALIEPGRAEATGLVSIESALRLCRSADAYPWLVVESSVGQEQINMMMSYLCGSISDPFGKIRVDNGTAVPWSRQFDRYVLEITDSDSIFVSDLQRGAYVNYVIELIEASPYYLDIKDKVVFVDAMQYDGGTMLSDADYHASSILADQTLFPSSEPLHERLESVISDVYLDYYDAIPRVISRSFDSGGQWINSSSLFLRAYEEDNVALSPLPYPIDAATLIHFVLNDYGRHTTMFCYDVQVSNNPYDLFTEQLFSDSIQTDIYLRQTQSDNHAIMFRVMNLLTEHISGAPTYAVITPSLSDVSERVRDGEANSDSNTYEGLVVYAFRDEGYVSTFVINLSDQPRSFMVETDFFSREITIMKFSEEALLISSSSLSRANTRYVLLPGQFLIVSGPVDDLVFSDGAV